MNDYINGLVFNLGDVVTMVLDAEIKGMITGILYTDAGIEYRVALWIDDARKQEWFSACELKK